MISDKDNMSIYGFEIVSGVLVSYRGRESEVIVPEGVVAIGKDAFKGNGTLKFVKLQEGVKEIGDSAFEGCGMLSLVSLPKSVETIGKSAFYGCSSIRLLYPLPQNLKKIGAFAFSYCTSLWRITIPEGTEEIGDCAFFGNLSMESVTIPASIKTIGAQAFEHTPRFTGVVYRGTRKEWKTFDLSQNKTLKRVVKVYNFKN